MDTLTIIDQLRRRKGYIPSSEVQAILGISRQTLCGYVTSGKLLAVRFANSNRFDPAHVIAFIEARTIGA